MPTYTYTDHCSVCESEAKPREDGILHCPAHPMARLNTTRETVWSEEDTRQAERKVAAWQAEKNPAEVWPDDRFQWSR